MAKTEYLGTADVAKLLGIPTPHIYGWVSDDQRKKRPFFPKSKKIRNPKGNRRLIHQWDKQEVLVFIAAAREKPYYLLSEHQYKTLKAERQQKDETLPSVFMALMFARKQKREVVNA